MKTKSTLRHSLLLAAGSSLLAVSSSNAALETAYWDGNSTNADANGGTGTWNSANINWDSAATAGSDIVWDANASGDDTAIFGGTAGTVTLGEAISLKNLTINTAGYIITGSTLNFTSGNINIAAGGASKAAATTIRSAITGSPTMTDGGAGATHTILNPTSGNMVLGAVTRAVDKHLYLQGSSTSTNSIASIAKGHANAKLYVESGNWTFGGNVYAGEFSMTGGSLVLNGTLSNDYRSINFSGGTLHWNNQAAIRDNATNDLASDRDFSISGGSIDNTSGAAITTSTTNPQIRWKGNWEFIGSNGANSNLNMGTGLVYLTGNRQVTVTNAATTLTVGGVISNDGTSGRGIIKAGAGTLSLSGSNANTYNGTTTINGGILALNKTAGVNAIAGAITLGDGATTAGNDILRLDANNQIADTAVITFNAATGSNAGIFRLNNRSETVAGIASTGGGGIIENESGSAATSTLTVNNSANQSFSGIIRDGDGVGTDGTLALAKSGSGILSLTNTNTYTGATAVNEGKLLVTGSIGASAVTVSNAGTILATAAAASFGSTLAINNGAILAAGDAGAAGTATVTGATTFNNGSIFSWDINATGASYDKLIAPSLVDGDTAGGSTFRIVVADSTFADTFWDSNQSWADIFTTDGTNAIANWADIFSASVVNGSFSPLDTSAYGTFSISGNTLSWTAIPEPGTALGGLLLTAGLLRRRRKVEG